MSDIMPIHQYQREADATKSTTFVMPGQENNPASVPIDVLHAMIGIATESGEFLNPAKKAMFYGSPIDFVNLDEEIGDLMWYIAIYCNYRNVDIEKICKTNNEKLKARFPNKFTEFHANNRDLNKERGILESGSHS
jgi:NTP pyrophosphatase (non-canonical NTP hydrolase)